LAPLGPFVIVLSLAGASCKTVGGGGGSIVQPGAPGQPTRPMAASAAADRSRIRYTAADVRFMQGMIGHHAQALEMTALVPSRTSRDALKLLAQRIDVSQRDEIAMMRAWLEARGQPVPDPHAHQHGAAAASPPASTTLMPGMLTAGEMTRLAAASGPAFDRFFLESMIKHHDGALVMVKALFATPGAGQEPEMFAFASDVDADQRMEIDRMSAMLKEWQQ